MTAVPFTLFQHKKLMVIHAMKQPPVFRTRTRSSIRNLEEQINSIKDNINMNTNQFDLQEKSFEHFRTRFFDAHSEKLTELMTQFGLLEDRPKNWEEQIRRIKNDEYTLETCYGVTEIRWTKVPRDNEGYNKAERLFVEVYNDAKDIVALDFSKAYEQLQRVKNWKYTA